MPSIIRAIVIWKLIFPTGTPFISISIEGQCSDLMVCSTKGTKKISPGRHSLLSAYLRRILYFFQAITITSRMPMFNMSAILPTIISNTTGHFTLASLQILSFIEHTSSLDSTEDNRFDDNFSSEQKTWFKVICELFFIPPPFINNYRAFCLDILFATIQNRPQANFIIQTNRLC